MQTRPILTTEWLDDLRYHQLIQEQNDIAWRHIFNGRLTLKWSELLAEHMFTIHNTEKHLAGTLWTSASIQEVWSQWQLVWIQRNEMLHERDETCRNEARRGRAAIMLHEPYSRKDFMKPSDHDKILFDDIEHHLAKPTHQIMNWISVHKPLVSHRIKETDRLAIQGICSLRTYFPVQPS
jgi:hypothetical protein